MYELNITQFLYRSRGRKWEQDGMMRLTGGVNIYFQKEERKEKGGPASVPLVIPLCRLSA
jgi:hypothetical protein